MLRLPEIKEVKNKGSKLSKVKLTKRSGGGGPSSNGISEPHFSEEPTKTKKKPLNKAHHISLDLSPYHQ
jgi:hypothetical protein